MTITGGSMSKSKSKSEKTTKPQQTVESGGHINAMVRLLGRMALALFVCAVCLIPARFLLDYGYKNDVGFLKSYMGLVLFWGGVIYMKFLDRLRD